MGHLLTPRTIFAVQTLAVIGLVTLVYWPVIHGGLIWDDKFYLHDRAWLRDGTQWLQAVLHGFPDWKIYFRPLGIALFAAQTRLFDADPIRMHLLSLGLHLLNILLVGAIARRLLTASHVVGAAAMIPVSGAMLLYGVHPALIEPVAWISSQCDLLVTLFTLLGIFVNLGQTSGAARGIGVGLCFFFAACSKESAISFPLLLLIIDWLRPVDARLTPNWRQEFIVRLQQQWPVYLSVLAAGVAYLLFRYWGLGLLLSNTSHAPWLTAERSQLICFTYLAYWKLLIWPMAGLNPLHIAAEQQFFAFGVTPCAIDLAAVFLVSAALYLLCKRKPLGGLMAGFTAALLPVLHILPVHFDESIYHERYATTAIAIVCAFLPLAVAHASRRIKHARAMTALCILVTAWSLMAMINIRVTLPLWSDEVRLWRWALLQNPGSILAQDSLLSTYVERNDTAEARPLAAALMRDGRDCAKCMLNVAFLALMQRDEKGASTALQQAKHLMDISTPHRALLMGYILASGNLSELQHNFVNAENSYNDAIALDPQSPEARMNLALLQVRQGNMERAQGTLQTALSLSMPDAQERYRKEFEQVVQESSASAMPSLQPHP